MKRCIMILTTLMTLSAAHAVDDPKKVADTTPAAEEKKEIGRAPVVGHEAIPYFERYQPSFFLLGKPYTKVQVSLKVQALRDVPLYFAFTQLMAWDLFKESAPFRDINYSPEIFYRLNLDGPRHTYLDFGPIQHESNGKAEPESRSWNRSYVRIVRDINFLGSKDRRGWWSAKFWIPMSMSNAYDKKLPEYRGLYEIEVAVSDFFGKIFEVNELKLRIYPGGGSRINPLRGGQELTYREKESSRQLLLPLYFQVFHGYGETLVEAFDNHWGVRLGIGF